MRWKKRTRSRVEGRGRMRTVEMVKVRKSTSPPLLPSLLRPRPSTTPPLSSLPFLPRSASTSLFASSHHIKAVKTPNRENGFVRLHVIRILKNDVKYLKYAKTVKYEKKGKLREGRIYRMGERPGRRVPLRRWWKWGGGGGGRGGRRRAVQAVRSRTTIT